MARAGSAGYSDIAPWFAVINAPQVPYTLPSWLMTWSCALLLSLTSSALQGWYIRTGRYMLPLSLSSSGETDESLCFSCVRSQSVGLGTLQNNPLLVVLQSEDKVRLCHMLY